MGCFAIASLVLQSIYCPCPSYEGFSCVHNLRNVWISERLQEGKLHTLLLLWKIQVRSVTEALLLIEATAARAAYCLHCWICWRCLIVVVDRLLFKKISGQEFNCTGNVPCELLSGGSDDETIHHQSRSTMYYCAWQSDGEFCHSYTDDFPCTFLGISCIVCIIFDQSHFTP